jgi:hypothetical protein
LVAKAGLLLSHPGHELRVYRMLELVRPLVWVVTDGSGRDASSRVATTERLLQAIGAPRGKLFGRVRDRDLYEAVRRGAVAFFTDLADEVSRDLVEHSIGLLVSDAPEQLILTHDLIAAVADSAVALAARSGIRVSHYDFVLHSDPTRIPAGCKDCARVYVLDAEALERKRCAAEAYREIAPEIAADRALHGDAAFATEVLRPVDEPFERLVPGDRPLWQQHGERLVQQGVYPEAISWIRHVRPIVEALRAHARG